MENLPYEIIVKILDYLSFHDLTECMLLSHSFRDFIIQTPIFMRKMKFSYVEEDWRNYQFLMKHGKYVKNLHLDGTYFEEEDDAFKLLTLVPNLEQLTTSYCNFGERIELKKTIEKVEFLNLTHVCIEERSKMHEILIKCLKNSRKLKSIELNFSDELKSNYHDILVQQNGLEELIFNSDFDQGLEFFLKSLQSTKFPFRLKKLVVNAVSYWNEDFAGFLRSQAGSVKELELGSCDDARYLELVLKEFKSLETITISFHRRIDQQINEKCRNLKLDSVKKLYLKSLTSMFELKAVMSLFPNIELLSTFDVKKFQRICYDELFENFNKLNINDLLNLKLPNLKFLKINKLRYDYRSLFWRHFIKNSPNIEVIIINNPTIIDEISVTKREAPAVFKSLRDLKKLKTFKYAKVGDERYEIEVDIARKLIQIDSAPRHFAKEIKKGFKNFKGVFD